ncbi:MAG: ATP-dependent Clp protease ATP-binding subunit [Gemmatimonadetes bacterium]|nr:ATP-dependent Clp protease ATP-binding subunit [Gemmatimonadota bacterium]
MPPRTDILDREDVVRQLVYALSQHEPDSVALVGGLGSGRTAILGALAAHLETLPTNSPLAKLPIFRVRADRVIGEERANTLRRIIKEVDPAIILALDDTDLLGALGGEYPDPQSVGVINALVSDPNRRSILVLTPAGLTKLGTIDRSLVDRLHVIDLEPLTRTALRAIAEARAPALAAFHQVEIPAAILDAATEPPEPDDRSEHPGLMLERLDLGCARAAHAPERVVTRLDLMPEAGLDLVPDFDLADVRAALGSRILGQEGAIASVVNRLAMTRRKLDLNPVRPDGVFLFVGPTGVGKTALGTALAETVYGDPEACIRLDMSEYAHDWALSRLVGPQPGYVGYTEPAGWLTTRIAERPNCVLLLDEIEKAHPTVWNAFLQVFDAGRLTDSRGTVVTFSDVIVIMTSNLGSESYRKAPLGFLGGDQIQTVNAKAVEAVKEAMAPELVNRLDEIVVFQPLSAAAITSIAEQEIDRVIHRLTTSGYQVTVPTPVVEWIARNGYDPAYGARHLSRSIERYLLQSLVAQPPGRWSAAMEDGMIRWASDHDGVAS